MQSLIKLFLLLICCSGVVPVSAKSVAPDMAPDLEQFSHTGDFSLVQPHVVEQHAFYGLAGYYNGLSFFKVQADGAEFLEPGRDVQFQPDEWLAAVGRFKALVIRAEGLSVQIGEESLQLAAEAPLPLKAHLLRKDELQQFDPALDQLRYANLWFPFGHLARAVEWSLVTLKSAFGLGWGMTIVLFSVLLKLLMVPLGVWAARLQARVGQQQSQLAPVLADIKAKYDGEEAHTRIVAAHKELGISMFFALKPMVVMFLQVPVWVAVFNALGEMPQLAGASFLWIDNLSYPDSVGNLPVAIPLLGSSVSLLPWLMTAVSILSTLALQNRHAPASEVKSQKRSHYLMALAFFVLFYPFPAAMVLYWTLSNALQIVQQRLIGD